MSAALREGAGARIMHMIDAVLSAQPTSVTHALPAGIAIDLLWNCALPEDCLEHIYSQHSHDRLQLVFFIRGKPFVSARDAVTAICRRALNTAPALRGWHLIQVGLPAGRQAPPIERTHP